jgi:Fanconi anemia group M protein
VSLDLGDIQVEDSEGNSLVIERKRCDGAHTKTDFESSVVDGRLFDQSERLKLKAGASDHQCIPIILLEGDLYTHAKSMLCQQIDGAISFLCAIQKMSVLPCLNQNHTAYVIAKLASHFKSGLFASVSLHKAKPKAIFEQKAYALESLPGVSSKTAEALLLAFGSVRAVMTASRTELLKVPGMGPKRVDALLVPIRKPVISSTTSDRISYSRTVVSLLQAVASGILFGVHRFGHSANGRRPCHSFWRDMSLVQRLPVQV